MAWLSGYSYRVKLTIPSGTVGSLLTDWPAYIPGSILPAGVWTGTAFEDLRDWRLTASDGTTELSHELDDYGSGQCSKAGTSAEIFGLLPSVSAVADNEYYLYFGKADASMPTKAAQAEVWTDSDHVGVWHLGENPVGVGNPGAYHDSTTVNHRDDQVSATGESGKLGKGQEFDGANDYIGQSAYVATGYEYTVSGWVYVDTAPHLRQWLAGISGANYPMNLCCSGGRVYRWSAFAGPTIETGAWHYIVYQHSIAGNDENFYYDGSPDGHRDGTVSGNHAFRYIGIHHDGVNYSWLGYQDEVRVATSIRSASWVAADYANQSDPASFWAVGAVEPKSVTYTETSTVTVTSSLSITDSLVATEVGTVTIVSVLSIAEQQYYRLFPTEGRLAVKFFDSQGRLGVGLLDTEGRLSQALFPTIDA